MSDPVVDDALERTPQVARLRDYLRREREPEPEVVAELLARAQQTVVLRDLVGFGFVHMMRALLTVLGTVFTSVATAATGPGMAPSPAALLNSSAPASDTRRPPESS